MDKKERRATPFACFSAYASLIFWFVQRTVLPLVGPLCGRHLKRYLNQLNCINIVCVADSENTAGLQSQ